MKTMQELYEESKSGGPFVTTLIETNRRVLIAEVPYPYKVNITFTMHGYEFFVNHSVHWDYVSRLQELYAMGSNIDDPMVIRNAVFFAREKWRATHFGTGLSAGGGCSRAEDVEPITRDRVKAGAKRKGVDEGKFVANAVEKARKEREERIKQGTLLEWPLVVKIVERNLWQRGLSLDDVQKIREEM